ncbi:glycosyl hydrolase family 28-related protein [Roseateles sp.]|uniref:glycosyl hydrolase family 28-related protein n=1 Tax=Roseateles sp. TaxID=1971397 RepID=UPI0031E14B8F
MSTWFPRACLSWLPLSLYALALDAGAATRCGEDTLPTREDLVLRCATELGVYDNTDLDQREALQSALHAAADTGAHLYLPPGNYNVSGDLHLPPGTGLIGSRNSFTRITGIGTETTVLRPSDNEVEGAPYHVEDLQLSNARIVLDSVRPAKIQFNVLSGTRSPAPQIEISRGHHHVNGNVLQRDIDGVGEGILVDATARSTSALGRAVKVSMMRNLIGAIPQGTPTKSKKRTMQLFVGQLRPLKPEFIPRLAGQYRTAIRTIGNVNATLVGNTVAIASSSNGGSTPRMADFEHGARLKLKGNRFIALGEGTGNRLTVSLRAPARATLDGNTLDGVDLRFSPSESSPGANAKNSLVSANEFLRSALHVEVSVNGAGDDHSSPADIKLLQNVFKGKRVNAPHPECDIVTRASQAGPDGFQIGGNLRGDLEAILCER